MVNLFSVFPCPFVDRIIFSSLREILLTLGRSLRPSDPWTLQCSAVVIAVSADQSPSAGLLLFRVFAWSKKGKMADQHSP